MVNLENNFFDYINSYLIKTILTEIIYFINGLIKECLESTER